MYSAYLMKPADASVPEDKNITSLLPSFKVGAPPGRRRGRAMQGAWGAPPSPAAHPGRRPCPGLVNCASAASMQLGWRRDTPHGHNPKRLLPLSARPQTKCTTPPRQASAARLQKAAQADIFDASAAASGGTERFMCPTVAFHSVAKSWAQRQDGAPVLYGVAPTNNLASSECDDACVWSSPSNNGTAEDVHFAIEFDRRAGLGFTLWGFVWAGALSGRLTPDWVEGPRGPSQCRAHAHRYRSRDRRLRLLGRRVCALRPPRARRGVPVQRLPRAHPTTLRLLIAHPPPTPTTNSHPGCKNGSGTSRPFLRRMFGATSASTSRAAWGRATYG
jgi:hypothetical protein